MTFIIAEAAQGHEGNELYARHLLRAAALAGADAVKFQLVVADDLAEPDYEYYPWYKKVEFTLEQWQRIQSLAKQEGIALVMDVFGPLGLKIARQLELHAIKLHSADFFNDDLIAGAYEAAPTVILSSAGLFLEELLARIEHIRQLRHSSRTVLLCGYQAEPTPIDKTSLGRILALKAIAPDFKIGFMDHTAGDGPDKTIISAMAVGLGVDYLEKHLTIDRFMKFDSFVSAIVPAEFGNYVAQMRRAHTAIGSTEYALLPEELVYRDKYIKKLLFNSDQAAGTALSTSMFTLKRTGRIANGAGYHNPEHVVGRVLNQAVVKGDPVIEEILS